MVFSSVTRHKLELHMSVFSVMLCLQRYGMSVQTVASSVLTDTHMFSTYCTKTLLHLFHLFHAQINRPWTSCLIRIGLSVTGANAAMSCVSDCLLVTQGWEHTMAAYTPQQ